LGADERRVGGEETEESVFLVVNPPLPPTPPPSLSHRKSPNTTGTSNRRLLLFSVPIFAAVKSANAIAATAEKYYDPVSQAEKESSAALSGRVSEAVELLEKGRELQAKGDFNEALLYFTQVVENYKDFAFSEYARVGRALALYEVGDKEQAIAEMEDVSISLKGYQEIHAALAAVLYVDKHAALLAENQFTIVTLLDPHYTDISYVKDTKHWPPSLVSSLKHFITLS